MSKPVAVFRFSPTEGAGRFGEFLAARSIPVELVTLDAGAAVPRDSRNYAGIGMMGGPMSVNDSLPWIEPLCALLRGAVGSGVPVLGHCLGGQLLARAMGASVTRAQVAEIGWWPVQTVGESAATWFGGRRAFSVFQWHFETFTLPAGAQPLLAGEYCANQAFVIDGRHLGFQCHIEMTRPMVESWCRTGAREVAEAAGPAVQSVAAMQADLDARLAGLSALADDVYAQWVRGLLP